MQPGLLVSHGGTGSTAIGLTWGTAIKIPQASTQPVDLVS